MKETQGLTKITYSCWRGRDTKGLWEGHEHTAMFKMDNHLCLFFCLAYSVIITQRDGMGRE